MSRIKADRNSIINRNGQLQINKHRKKRASHFLFWCYVLLSNRLSLLFNIHSRVRRSREKRQKLFNWHMEACAFRLVSVFFCVIFIVLHWNSQWIRKNLIKTMKIYIFNYFTWIDYFWDWWLITDIFFWHKRHYLYEKRIPVWP